MQRASPLGLAILLLATALAVGSQSVSAGTNTTAGTVVSTGGPSVVVRTDSGDEVSVMLDEVSVALAKLDAGDRVTFQYHPTEDGGHPIVTMTREPARGMVAKGVAVDSDGDGVPDGMDNCPDTPRACRVDAHGCPIDTDGDGICDSLDKCPGTPVLTTVDRNGCPLPVDVPHLETELLDTGMIRLSNVNFDYDESAIRPDAYAVLDTVGRVLTKWPGLDIQIDAYCDSRGTEAYNYDLSERRAESVRSYLLEHFPEFGPAQLTARHYGESNPLAPNTTMANMQLNRRVEFVVRNKEMLKQKR